MNEKYKALRKKMARFNEWEAMNRKNLSAEKRLAQFFALYDLGRWHGEQTIMRVHEEHLRGMIQTNRRLMERLGTVSRVMSAAVDDLTKVEGLGKGSAEKIRKVLNSEF